MAAAKDAAVALSSGHRMPAVGLGVWRMDKRDVRGLIHAALRVGYRHLDCAGKRNPPGTRPPTHRESPALSVLASAYGSDG
jgi:hypothetical protein